MVLVTILLTALTTVIKKFGRIALNKVRDYLLGSIDKRSTLYSIMKSELTDIGESVENVINEPLKTAITYYLFALDTGDRKDFSRCEKASIKAFHISKNIKNKSTAICLTIFSMISLYDDRSELSDRNGRENRVIDSKIKVLMGLFLEDKYIINLFSHIYNKKYDNRSLCKHSGFFLTAWVFTIATFPISYPMVLYVSSLTIDAYICKNFFVNEAKFTCCNMIGSIIYGVTKNTCHIDGRLMFIDMPNEVNDIKYVDEILSVFTKILNITDEIKLSDHICWEIDRKKINAMFSFE